MTKKKLISIISAAVAVVLVASLTITLVFCGKSGSKKDSIVIMSEALSGLYNPFYATSGADMDVVGMTQISMLSTDSNGNVTAGADEATVVLDYAVEEVKNASTGETEETVYTFVIKNGLKFSDGVALTMNDVMFNIYEYLDPVYTGSSTMYSVDIKGLSYYRTQESSSGSSSSESNISELTYSRAANRLSELNTVYKQYGLINGSTTSYSLDEEKMIAAIKDYCDDQGVSEGYKIAVAVESEWDTYDFKQQLLDDYAYVLKTFREELESDYTAALESYDMTSSPYKDMSDDLKAYFDSDIFKFLLYEGKITTTYAKIEGTSRDDLTKITGFENVDAMYGTDGTTEKTKEQAIELIYNDNVDSEFLTITSAWGTAGTVKTQFAAEAKDVYMHSQLEGDELIMPYIEGIVSLGHPRADQTAGVGQGTNSEGESIVTFTSALTSSSVSYKIATTHNADGTPEASGTYDVLQITINGVDPKAIYNFGFTVAPVHYYSNQTVDIENNKFGVLWSDSDFQSNVIQSQQNQEVPLGAGPYMATDAANSDKPAGSDFVSGNVVYFKSNPNFMFEVKTEKLRFQVVSSTDAIDALASGQVDYITPQYTKENYNTLNGMSDVKMLSSWQLGYGYIGINAGEVENLYLRKAIMSAMETALAAEYYVTGTVTTIYWPMSTVSWAYPKDANGNLVTNNDYTYEDGTTANHDYTRYTKTEAIEKIKKYMQLAGYTPGVSNSDLTIRFTIAGSSISEHPVYNVFKQAAEILNSDELGWNVEVKADSQALTKLATGSLAVWAAAWGSTVDPDMYQVYHKDSTATSVYAWGYREIISGKSDSSDGGYGEQYSIIESLSDVIDEARETTDQSVRTSLYKEAMSYVLDLAVELPVYQRMNLYAYNSKTIKGLNEDVNPYSTPLEKVWELELVG